MQSEKLSLTLEKELVVTSSFDSLESKDDKNQQNDNQKVEEKGKKARKSTKVKLTKRLCIFE